MKTILRTILGLLALSSPAFAADGVAFISDLKGEVAVDGNPRPLVLSELAKGQKVIVGRESQASVMYTSSGKEFVLKGPAEYVVKETEIAGSTAAPVARATEWRASSRTLTQVAQTSAASVRMRSLSPPKQDAAVKAVFPAEGSIATLQPTFRWRADEAKAPAEFTLMVVGQEKPVHSAKVSGGSYRVSAKLRPETEYAWTAVAAGSEVGAGQFRTLTPDALARIEKRRPAERSEFSDRLLFALMLQEMGAVQEAREAWSRLAQERADLPELAALAR
jgi:hypothetical protein